MDTSLNCFLAPCIVSALPMTAPHWSWEEQILRTWLLPSLFPFPQGFCKTLNYATTHFVFSLSKLPIQYPAFLIISNMLEPDLGWNPGSAAVWCNLCDPRQVTSPLWVSFSSSGKWGLTHSLTPSPVNGCIMWLWLLQFKLRLNQEQRIRLDR